MISLSPFVPRFDEQQPVLCRFACDLFQRRAQVPPEEFRCGSVKHEAAKAAARGVVPVRDHARVDVRPSTFLEKEMRGRLFVRKQERWPTEQPADMELQ